MLDPFNESHSVRPTSVIGRSLRKINYVRNDCFEEDNSTIRVFMTVPGRIQHLDQFLQSVVRKLRG